MYGSSLYGYKEFKTKNMSTFKLKAFENLIIKWVCVIYMPFVLSLKKTIHILIEFKSEVV